MFDAFRKSSGSLFRATTLVTALTSAFLPAVATAQQQPNFSNSNGAPTKLVTPPTPNATTAAPATNTTALAAKWIANPIGAPEKGKVLKIADNRGRGEDIAILASLAAAERGFVSVLIGNDEKVIREVELGIAELIMLEDCDNLVLVIGDITPNKGYIHSQSQPTVRFTNLTEIRDLSGQIRAPIKEAYGKAMTVSQISQNQPGPTRQ